MSAFFELHRDLPREGPGEPFDIAWAADHAGVARGGRVMDAGCGPGADIPALLKHFEPETLVAVDQVKHFVKAAQARFFDDPRVLVAQRDMLIGTGEFDMIWCAGAIYFAGIVKSLSSWTSQLADTGVIAFSSPCYFTQHPSKAAVAFWEGEGDIPTFGGIKQQIGEAGFSLIAHRRLSDAAWDAYYHPMQARIDQLRPNASAELHRVLDQGVAEISSWRAARAEAGYMLCVVRRA